MKKEQSIIPSCASPKERITTKTAVLWIARLRSARSVMFYSSLCIAALNHAARNVLNMPTVEKAFKLKIGADPEFSVLWNNQRVPANQVLANLFRDDSRRNGSSVRTSGGELGVDGCNATGELRPNPSLDPLETAKNIGLMIEAFAEKGMGFDLSTLSLWAPIGGHIHLELPENVASSDVRIKQWHRQLMSFYMPVMMGEEKASVKLRCSSYGKIDDVRGPEGNRRTMEVRCPSAEWITTRKVCEAMLAYMSVVWHEVIHNPKSLPQELLVKTEKQLLALQDMAVNDFNLVNQSILKLIATTIRKFEMYPKYKDQIEYILKPQRVLADKREVGFSIKEGWGFTKSTKGITKRLFLSGQKNAPVIDGESFGVFHNDDFRTGMYAEELRKKVSSGMKLNHTYYIFGLKKGIKGTFLAHKDDFYLAPDYATDSDIAALARAKSKMQQKACQYEKERTSLDFKKGHVKKEIDRAVLVGIPFAEREKNDLKPFLEAIWKFEKNDLKPIKLVPKDRVPGNPPVQALIPEGEGTTNNISPDVSSQGAGYAERAINEMIREQDRSDFQALMAETQERLTGPLHDFLVGCKPKLYGRHICLELGKVVESGSNHYNAGYRIILFFGQGTGTELIDETEIVNGDRRITLPKGLVNIHVIHEVENLSDTCSSHGQSLNVSVLVHGRREESVVEQRIPANSFTWVTPVATEPVEVAPAQEAAIGEEDSEGDVENTTEENEGIEF